MTDLPIDPQEPKEPKQPEDINNIKVFSFEEVAKIVSSRLDEVSEHINNIPKYVSKELERIKAVEKEARDQARRYMMDVLLTGGSVGAIVSFLLQLIVYLYL